MLDVDGSGELDFHEFYLLCCILVSVKDQQGKEFIYRHSRTVFDLLDEDGSSTISAEEFSNFAFLFNFHGEAVRKIFQEFDVSGDQELDYKEFKLFAMACIDMHNDLQSNKKIAGGKRDNETKCARFLEDITSCYGLLGPKLRSRRRRRRYHNNTTSRKIKTTVPNININNNLKAVEDLADDADDELETSINEQKSADNNYGVISRLWSWLTWS